MKSKGTIVEIKTEKIWDLNDNTSYEVISAGRKKGKLRRLLETLRTQTATPPTPKPPPPPTSFTRIRDKFFQAVKKIGGVFNSDPFKGDV